LPYRSIGATAWSASRHSGQRRYKNRALTAKRPIDTCRGRGACNEVSGGHIHSSRPLAGLWPPSGPRAGRRYHVPRPAPCACSGGVHAPLAGARATKPPSDQRPEGGAYLISHQQKMRRRAQNAFGGSSGQPRKAVYGPSYRMEEVEASGKGFVIFADPWPARRWPSSVAACLKYCSRNTRTALVRPPKDEPFSARSISSFTPTPSREGHPKPPAPGACWCVRWPNLRFC